MIEMTSSLIISRPKHLPAADPANPGSPLPFANPANIAFDNHGNLLATNHAGLTGLPDPSPLFAVFSVFVNDKAGNLFGGDP